VSTYTIGEAARRSGFSASALRFYEEIGVVDPAGRTASGYRLYDDDALDRLAFVARAKQLGCSLEEIIDLAELSHGDHCGPVQRRLRDLVTDKIAAAEARAAELRTFTGQLRSAADRLRGEPTAGPCGPACACVAGEADGAPPVEASPVTLGRASDAGPPHPPVACTLDPDAIVPRRAEWAAVLSGATRRRRVDGGLRIELGPDVDLGDLARLIGAEQQCCAFFRFALLVDAGGTALEARAPDVAGGVVDELFGPAA